jgi:hypothetical protein
MITAAFRIPHEKAERGVARNRVPDILEGN